MDHESRSPARIPASPLARRLAAERGLDLSRIGGSGPGGRVVKADVETRAAALPAATAASEDSHAASRPPLSPSDQARTGAQMTLRVSIRTARLLALLAEVNPVLAPRGEALSVADFCVKACAVALQDSPDCTREGAEIAVLADGGPQARLIRGADALPLPALSAQLKTALPGPLRPAAIGLADFGPFGIESVDLPAPAPLPLLLALGAPAEHALAASLSVDPQRIAPAAAARLLAEVRTRLEAPGGLLV